MYEGDGIIRSGPKWDGPGPEHGPETASARDGQPSKQPSLAHLFRELLGWARTKLRSTSALDDYLSRASSLADVERLLRKAESEKRFYQY